MNPSHCRYIHHSFQRLTGVTKKKRWGSTSPTMADAFYRSFPTPSR